MPQQIRISRTSDKAWQRNTAEFVIGLIWVGLYGLAGALPATWWYSTTWKEWNIDWGFVSLSFLTPAGLKMAKFVQKNWRLALKASWVDVIDSGIALASDERRQIEQGEQVETKVVLDKDPLGQK